MLLNSKKLHEIAEEDGDESDEDKKTFEPRRKSPSTPILSPDRCPSCRSFHIYFYYFLLAKHHKQTLTHKLIVFYVNVFSIFSDNGNLLAG